LTADPEAGTGEVVAEPTADPESPWDPSFFARDLFLEELLDDAFRLELDGRRYKVRKRFLLRVWGRPPVDGETIRLRQEILRELSSDGAVRDRVGTLYRRLTSLLGMFKSPRSAQLDPRAYRLEVLEMAKGVIDRMVTDFADARSELRRISEAGRDIQGTPEYARLAALLDYDDHLATLRFEVKVGADGGVRDLTLLDVKENDKNPLHKPPGKRWADRIQLLGRGVPVSSRELVNRLILEVYLELAPALRSLLQVLGHLEVYLTSLAFRDWAAARGLPTCLAKVEDGAPFTVEALYNPLLARQGVTPVPCSIGTASARPSVLVTGPNSGGKTRLLQAVGLAQLLGQSGLYVPAARAHLPRVEGLFASIVEQGAVDQAEGRLGTELLRIRRLFENARPGSLLLLDELCAGTNPSEAVEIFSLVLRLLERLAPVAFITTHFLDHAQELARGEGPGEDLEFLQVEIDADRRSTYQFVPGVATTSLAEDVAERLGVSYDALSDLLEKRSAV
jgi:DNA mismatch repair protein MutS2